MRNPNRTRYAKLLLAVLLLTALPALAGCGGKADSGDGKTEVRIGYFPNITHAQALVLKRQGTLEAQWEGEADVSWTAFNAGPAETEAIFAGEIDIGYIGPVPALNANVTSGGEVKILTGATDAGAVLLKRADADISSAKDLTGKKVAVPQLGNTQHLCLLQILDEHGLSSTDAGGSVEITASANADIVNLMDSGTVDAALVPEPWGSAIEKNGNAEVLLDYDEIFAEGNYPTAVVVVSEDFAGAHPELVEEFLAAHEEATAWIRENQTEAIGLINAEIGETTGKTLDSDVIASAFSRMTVTAECSRDAVLTLGEISKREGFISEVPEESDVFTDKRSE